ncbi:MAG: hypothetical protein M5R36_14645 [Deltaproteobacteria bacterium]|nr:hypothetical protein [Deltaproteobacteria bacterium]
MAVKTQCSSKRDDAEPRLRRDVPLGFGVPRLSPSAISAASALNKLRNANPMLIRATVTRSLLSHLVPRTSSLAPRTFSLDTVAHSPLLCTRGMNKTITQPERRRLFRSGFIGAGVFLALFAFSLLFHGGFSVLGVADDRLKIVIDILKNTFPWKSRSSRCASPRCIFSSDFCSVSGRD